MSTSKDNIIYGGPVTSSVTCDFKAFSQFALKQLQSKGDKIILVDGVTGEEFSAKQIHDRIVRLAYCLQSLKIKEGDAVGLSSENKIDFVVTTFATFCLNATLAPLNVTYTEREIHHAVNLSSPKVFFASASTVEKVAKIAKINSFIKNVFVFADSSQIKGVEPISKLLNNPNIKSSSTFEPKATNIDKNVALIVCSSGTTGLPKGVQLTQKNIMRTVDRQFEADLILEDITILSVIPWFHSFGCLTMILMCCVGTKFIYLPKFDEHLFLNCIEKYQVNMAFMVPPLMVFLAKHPIVDKYNLSSLTVLLCGAAPLSKETEDAVKKRIGVPLIRQGYGLSESTLSLLVQTEEFCKPGSVGILKAGTWAKVIDTETGKPLGPHQRGELCFKGDCIMKGYVGDKKSTRGVLDKEGWLHTGDIGYYDQDFEFFIVDRIKELIKYKAFQVPPAEIEALLLAHSNIKDAAVVGLPDEECGELPFAFIVKQPNCELTEKEIYDYIAARASPAKRLRGGVEFISEIPKNPSGKILRRILKDMLKSRLKSKL